MKIRINILVLVLTTLFGSICFHGNSQNLKALQRKADKAMERGKYTEAIPFLKSLLLGDSTDSFTLFDLSLALYHTKDYNGCIKHSTKGMEVDSTFLDHSFHRALCYMELTDYPSAIRDFTKSIQLKETPFSYFDRAIARCQSEDHYGAIIDFTAALAMDPKIENGYYYRGQCYEDIGDTLNAMTDYDTSITLNSKDSDIYFSRAHLKFQSKNYSDAKADFLKVIQFDPTNASVHSWLSEISVINCEWLEAYLHASNAEKYAITTDDHVVALILKCTANSVMNKSTSTDEALLNELFEELEEVGWEFNVLRQALKNQQIAEEKQRFINSLIEIYYE